MSEFVVVTFPNATLMQQATAILRRLHAEGGTKLYASTLISTDSDGKLSFHEITHEGLGGTAVGALIGGLAGLPLGPLAMTIGAAGGALIGKSADDINQEAETEFSKRIAEELSPGKAVVVADVNEDALTSFETSMKAIGGTVVRK